VTAHLLTPWLGSGNLVLLYVLAVIGVGLRHGARPALATALLSFLSFNFFLTEPRHTFAVEKQDDISTLIFLSVIALICGPAASRIRRQFLLLKESNRYSEALRALANQLTVADSDTGLWNAVTRELATALQVECIAVTSGDDGSLQTSHRPSQPFNQLDAAAIEWSRKQGAPSGRLTDTLAGSAWSLFPVRHHNKTIAVIMLRFDSTITRLQTYDSDLISAMLQQAADAWQRIHLARDLESARVKTEVEQLRSALLSSVSHDLRSPLSAMMGAAESLQLLDTRLAPQDRHELIDTLLQESRRLDRYIQNLLDMTRLGHGTLKIERDWVAAADIIGSALTRLKRYFPAVRTEFHTLGEPPLLYAHAALVEQALFNILENAARFSPPEEPVTVSLSTVDNTCRIIIEDRGPGIPESVREKIFDMFYVVADGDQKKHNTGMGLAICRGMIGAHGGSVRAEAGSDSKGTRFVVELPLTPTRNEDSV
jgi:two-component system sensor histidine kinase KdpD